MSDWTHICYDVGLEDMEGLSAIVRLPDRSCRVWLEEPPALRFRLKRVAPITYEITLTRERAAYYGLTTGDREPPSPGS